MILIDNDSEAEITNPYYAPTFAAYFLKTFLPYGSMIGGLMLPFINKKMSRVSNANAESHYESIQKKCCTFTK